MGEKADKLRELADKTEEVEVIEEDIKTQSEELGKWLSRQPIRDNEQVAKNYAQEFNMNLTQAKKSLFVTPEIYQIQGNDIPSVIKQMKYHRRTLKGEPKLKFTKAIDNLVEGYSSHMEKMIDNIYWLKKYKIPLKKMNFTESDLIKLSSIEQGEDKRKVIDCLCKYWEYDINKRDLSFNKEYAHIFKDMTKVKKEFTLLLKQTLISNSPKEDIRKSILKSVCERPGVSSREIHDSLPKHLYNRSSPQIISKLAREQNITSVSGAYYKINDDIKKNIWAYTAAFIDSDGYITMDRNHSPRVGLVATGDRGKAFMMEMKKSLGMGRLHLDQKSPQNTRLVNRLNFYSAGDISELLTKCMPHFRMKKSNAEILLELIKIKKHDKKKYWYKNRKDELFKLMKYNNHKDNINFDWKEWDIDIDNINKLEENSKMEV